MKLWKNLALLSRSPLMISRPFVNFVQYFQVSSGFRKITEENLHEDGRFTACLEMLKTSNTIEQVLPFLDRYRNAEEEAAIQQHCCNNMMHNRITLVRQKGLLAANVPNCAWPLILKEFSDMPEVLYYLLQQKHGAMIGPTGHGCKRKQYFD